MKRASLALGLGLTLALGCAATAPDGDLAASEAALRPMAAEEVLGEIGYGETKDLDVAPSPKYRAYWFRGVQGDQVQVQVVSRDATDPVLWLTDEAGTVVSMNNDVRVTDANAQIIRFLPQTGKYFVVFREMNASPRAKFSVAVRKLGAMPLDCDPDGEGIFLPECTDPLDVDPFDASSCSGPALSVEAATSQFPGPDPSRLSGSKIYYRTRQCKVTGGVAACSPWVRAHGMDVVLTSVAGAVPAASAPRTWAIVADATRKVKVEFTLGTRAEATNKYCVDGPFKNRLGSGWTSFEDGSGVCASNVMSAITPTCARFEPQTIQISSGNPTYYTEFGSVLLASY